jgi:ABC-2 type transport system ATP-binding protein
VFGLIYSVDRLAERIESLLADYDLERHRKTKCGLLSSGEQTRVALAKAMLNRPKLLLLDEPTASIDPATAREVRARIAAFAKEERSAILWTSHNMYEVAEVCHRVMFLAGGRILLEGEPARLISEHGAATLEDLFVSVAHERLDGESRPK